MINDLLTLGFAPPGLGAVIGTAELTGLKALDLLMNRLGKRTDLELRGACLAEMNLIQTMELERADFLPWFLRSEDQGLALGQEQELVALSSDFLGFDDDWGEVYYRDVERDALDQWTRVLKWTEDPEKIVYFDSEPGPPKAYALVGQHLRIRPFADKDYTIRALFYKRGLVVVDNDEPSSPWLTFAGDWLIAETGFVMASQYLQNDKLAKSFSAQLIKAKDRVYRQNESRRHTGQSYTMGEKP